MILAQENLLSDVCVSIFRRMDEPETSAPVLAEGTFMYTIFGIESNEGLYNHGGNVSAIQLAFLNAPDRLHKKTCSEES